MTAHPVLVQPVLDTDDPRRLADFYRRLLGLAWRPGDEADGDWFVLVDGNGRRVLAVQGVAPGDVRRPTWPSGEVPQQLHLDMTVASPAELAEACDLALSLGAEVLLDRSADEEEPLWVLADPAGHPFCIFVPVA